MSLKVGIIGCGRPGRGQARHHAAGYKDAGAELVALADVVEENATAFREEHGTGTEKIYTDYHEMLRSEKLDVVSICTWPHLHAQMVIDAANAKVPGIHCEKPMSTSWGESKRMIEAAQRNGVQVTFNHQRRFNEPFVKAKELLDAGEIGKLQRMECACHNLYDWGTHWFDMMFFYNNDTPAEWVFGQMEWRGARTIFGVPMEQQGISQIKFANEVLGLLVTGAGEMMMGARNRLVGTEGIIEVAVMDLENKRESPQVRYQNAGTAGWREVPTKENIHSPEAVAAGIADLLDALQTGREPQLSINKAARATEAIFATYESSVRRGRVDLPLDAEESGLMTILKENGAVPENSMVS